MVLGVAFVLEGDLVPAGVPPGRGGGGASSTGTCSTHVLATSDPTVRAVFFEDAAALVGIVIAAAGIALHEVTGSPVPDAIGSILVGVLLGVVAVVLIDRNRRFLVGEVVGPRGVNEAALQPLLALPRGRARDQLRLEFVGARQVYLTGAVDLTGEPSEDERVARARRARAPAARVARRRRRDALAVGAGGAGPVTGPDEGATQPPEAVVQEPFRVPVLDLLRLAVPAALVGIGCALTLYVLSRLAGGLEHLVWDDLSAALGMDRNSAPWIIGVLTATGLLIGLVVRYVPGHAGPDPATQELVAAPLVRGCCRAWRSPSC